MDEKRLQEIEANMAADLAASGMRLESWPHEMRELIAEVRKLRAGEFICERCGIRKDADASLVEPTF